MGPPCRFVSRHAPSTHPLQRPANPNKPTYPKTSDRSIDSLKQPGAGGRWKRRRQRCSSRGATVCVQLLHMDAPRVVYACMHRVVYACMHACMRIRSVYMLGMACTFDRSIDRSIQLIHSPCACVCHVCSYVGVGVGVRMHLPNNLSGASLLPSYTHRLFGPAPDPSLAEGGGGRATGVCAWHVCGCGCVSSELNDDGSVHSSYRTYTRVLVRAGWPCEESAGAAAG